ncbi:MAG: hypothetical protein LBV16_06165, partial [Elusimicrobiota bacterium]|nr:hypothetical protein [Elusimicrobiota bacterium]
PRHHSPKPHPTPKPLPQKTSIEGHRWRGGGLVSQLSPFVKTAYGADTSDLNIENNKRKYSNIRNLSFFSLSPNAYTQIAQLPIQEKPTIITCISVLQYYKSLDEIGQLIENAKKIASPNCIMILIDLLADINVIKDFAYSVIGSIFAKTFWAQVQEVFSGRYGKCPTLRKKQPLLTMKRTELENLCAAHKVSLKFIKRKMTQDFARTNVALELFPKTKI